MKCNHCNTTMIEMGRYEDNRLIFTRLCCPNCEQTPRKQVKKS